MEMRERASGILVLSEKPKKRRPIAYGPLELSDETRRAAAEAALEALWDAMELSEGHHIPLRSAAVYEAYWQAYHYIGKMLLGQDCPGKEVLT